MRYHPTGKVPSENRGGVELAKLPRASSLSISSAARQVEGDTIGQIGIGPHTGHAAVSLVQAVSMSTERVWLVSWLILDFIGEIFQGERSTDELGGPLRIAQMAGETADQG